MVPLLLETVRIENGKPLHLPYHQRRLERTLLHFGIAPRIDLNALIVPPYNEGIWRCRIVYDTRVRSIEYLPYAAVSLRRFKLVETTMEYPYKFADRTPLEALKQRYHDYDDVIIVKNGFVTDTTIANLAFFDGNKWITPDTPLLKGTTRDRLIDEGKITPQPIPIDALRLYKGMALINAMIGFSTINQPIVE